MSQMPHLVVSDVATVRGLPLVPAIRFTVEGICVPWARAGSRGRRRFTPERQAMAMADMRWYAKAAMMRAGINAPLTEPVALTIEAIYEPPPSWPAKRREAALGTYRPHRPDVDNILKLLSDALNRVTYLDDAQVVKATVVKLWGTSAELRVSLETV